jgi:hypothetical protein
MLIFVINGGSIGVCPVLGNELCGIWDESIPLACYWVLAVCTASAMRSVQ